MSEKEYGTALLLNKNILSKEGYFDQTKQTPYLNGRKLSTNFFWDFKHVLDTMDPY